MEERPRSISLRFREFVRARRGLVTVGGFLATVFLVFLLAPNRHVGPVRPPFLSDPDRLSSSGEVSPLASHQAMGSGAKEANALLAARPYELYKSGAGDAAAALPEPRIAYSAELTVATKEFVHSRATLEEILERHRGYVAKLRMVGQPNGSLLSATLRVPSSEYRSALTELKAVGLVEHEEESADEITQQHGELDARLVNAQNEERRILQMLQNRTQPIRDPQTLERQISILRSEIAQLEAERSSAGSRVSFANVFFSLREDRITPAETVGAKLRAAAVSGLSDAFESVSVLLLFLAGRGPMLALWATVLYFPARFFWHRRSQLAFRQSEAPKNS